MARSPEDLETMRAGMVYASAVAVAWLREHGYGDAWDEARRGLDAYRASRASRIAYKQRSKESLVLLAAKYEKLSREIANALEGKA